MMEGARSLLIALIMDAARTSETLVNFYQTTRRYNPEDSHLQIYYCTYIQLHLTRILQRRNAKQPDRRVLGTYDSRVFQLLIHSDTFNMTNN
jgi:hypothetical protein